MKLKSFGCSFIFGTDLQDDGRDRPYPTVSQYTWPALLARHLGYDYECRARPGAGNLQIWENIGNEIAVGERCLYVIGWTWIDRFDYIREDAPYWWGPTRWQTIMPIHQDSITSAYYRDLHSEHLDKMKSLIYIQSAVDLLLAADIPFVMTVMDDLLLDQRWNVSSGMLPIQNRIRSYVSTFDGKNLLDFSRDRDHAISDTSHPLESAHEDAAQWIIKDLPNIIKGNTTCLQNAY